MPRTMEGNMALDYFGPYPDPDRPKLMMTISQQTIRISTMCAEVEDLKKQNRKLIESVDRLTEMLTKYSEQTDD